MNGSELTEIIERLGMNRSDVAVALGIDEGELSSMEMCGWEPFDSSSLQDEVLTALRTINGSIFEDEDALEFGCRFALWHEEESLGYAMYCLFALVHADGDVEVGREP